MLIIGGIPQEAVEAGGDLTTVVTSTGTTATNTGNTATSAGTIATNTGTTATNTGNTATSAGTIATNTGNTATSAGTIATNTGNTATSAGTIATNTGNAATALTRAVKVPAVLTKANATPGTALPLAASDATNAIEILITARKVGGVNTGNVYFGTSAVHRTTSQQNPLEPGDVVHMVAPVGSFYDLNDYYVDADNAADGVTGFYVPA